MTEKKQGIGCCGGIVILSLLGLAFLFSAANNAPPPPPPANPAPDPAIADAALPEDPTFKPIPGLKLANIVKLLVEKGLTLKRLPGRNDGTGVRSADIWECKGKSPTADLWSNTFGYAEDRIDAWKGQIMPLQTGDYSDEAKAFLGHLAAVPYDGADPARAREWLETNLMDKATTTIGGVKFELTGNNLVRILSMSRVP